MIAAGSIPWLMRHELRLALRVARKPWRLLLLIVVALVALHGIAIPASWAVIALENKMGGKINFAPALPLLGGLLWFTFGMTVMNAIGRTLNALFVRNDLDLLFSSPISPHRVLAVRAFAIVLVSVLPLAIFVLPFANVLAVVAGVRWLSLYLLVLCVAVAGTVIAMPICVGLVRTIGVRRAQTLGQVVGILFGLTFALGSQIGVGPRGVMQEASRRGFYLAGDAPPLLRWSGALVVAEPLPMLGCLLISSLVLLLLSRWFGAAFATIAATSSARATRIGRATARGAIHFAETSLPGLFARKEWRLIARNPALLLSVLSAPLLQLIPLALIAFRNEVGAGAQISALWVLLVLMIGQVAGGLGWLAQSGEDAPDLLRLAPVDPVRITRAKAIAALVPLLPILAVASLAIALVEFEYGVAIFVCGAGAALSCALLNVWYIEPGDRRKFAARRKGHWGLAVAELALSGLWSLAAWKAIDHRPWSTVVPVVLALGLLRMLRRG